MLRRPATPMLLVLVAALSAVPGAARAQEPSPAVDSLRIELERLRTELDSLRALVRRLEIGAPAVEQDTTTDPLAAIRAAALAAAGADTVEQREQPQPEAFVGRQRNLSALNPEISVTGDVFGFVNSQSEDTDNIVAREFEFSFQSNLDPYSRAKFFVGHHSEGGELGPFGEAADHAHGGEGGGVEIEEGYVEWVALPGGFSAKLGRFRQNVGTLNRWHAHALPMQQYPLSYQAFFGGEGLAQTGASVHWLVPIHGLGTYEVWGELTRSSNELLFGESRKLSALAHVNAFWDLSPSTYFELGLTGLTGPYDAAPDEEHDGEEHGDFTTRLFGADFNLNWRPPGRALYREFTLRGGVLLNRREFDEAPRSDAWGGFVLGELKFAQQWLIGARAEYVQSPDDPALHAWLVAPTLTWWQSEWVRLRAEYDYIQRPAESIGQLVLQATFAVGPHKHETY